MTHGTRRSWLAIAVLLGAPGVAGAGMPHWMLTDVARLRVEAISFFGVAFLVSCLVVQRVWNWLRRDFPRLPRLSYGRAIGVVGLWGLLFLLVLTMISGARELLTPGAWERDGATYKLASRVEEEATQAERVAKMGELKAALWKWALAHDGRLPGETETAEIDRGAWETAEVSRIPYEYAGAGKKVGDGAEVVAYEPAVFGWERVVLTADGAVSTMSRQDVERCVGRKGDVR